MKLFKFLLSLLVATGLTWVLNTKLGNLPPLGKLLDPFHGFWHNAEALIEGTTLSEEKLQLSGLKDEVTVLYDDNHVPHIFAKNDYDLYYAQGYIQARDRLWQLDFVTRSAAGRLSEVVGEMAIPLDRYKRRMGSVYAAETSYKAIEKKPSMAVDATAYANGINDYIAQLKPEDYPIEFKVLDYAPEKWSPVKSILLLKEMSFVLASGTDDMRMSNVLGKLGQDVMSQLFPDYPSLEDPIIPNGTKFEGTILPVKTPTITKAEGDKTTALIAPERDPNIGSNNWAVHGSRTATGLPILAGDPHLSLNLPSIWYQIQLHAPGVNTYGVTLPGSPGVIIGFNENCAWTVTNVGSDVVDWYEIKFKDATKNEYWYNGQWKKTTKRLEVIGIRGKEAQTDTVVYTHHGPVVYQEGEKAFSPANVRGSGVPQGHALRWIALEESNELATTHELNRTKNYNDYVKALKPYACPAQNFCFASNENDVAIWVNGKFPLKWKEQGKYLLDGSNPDHDWQGWIPQEQNPHVRNPARGYVSSANQFSVNPKDYPYYLHWQFAPANRGRRINERLGKMTNVTVDSLRLLQFDNMNVDARDFLPLLLKNLSESNLSPTQKAAYMVLAKWNYENTPDAVAPTIFEEWMRQIRSHVWKDDLPENDSLPYRYPSEYRTVQMIQQEPKARWFDDVSTKDKTETLTDILQRSFGASIDSLTVHNGPMSPVSWRWAKVKNTTIAHLVPAFKSFSREGINVGGGGRIVNASTAKTGPSWRMVVELSKNGPRAFGLYPGGQSGNPGSKYYDNMIEPWAKGELNELVFLKNKDEAHKKIIKKMILGR